MISTKLKSNIDETSKSCNYGESDQVTIYTFILLEHP